MFVFPGANDHIFVKMGNLSRITILQMCLNCFIIVTVVIIVFGICMAETVIAMVNF